MTRNSLRHTPAARSKWAAAAMAIALAVGLSGLFLQSASAVSLPLYDENDSPNPINVTNGLVFYKAADLGWTVNGEDGVTIASIDSLAYTVEDSTSFAPSFQLISTSDQKPYARLVWEAYQQTGSLDPNEGSYTDLQDGIWWTNKIPSGAGSQADPQPLSFFDDGGSAGWTNVTVGAIDIHQGTTTESTSLVTNVNYNGDDIDLGNPDTTPFAQADVDDAVADYSSTHHTVDGTDLGEFRVKLSKTPVHGTKVGLIAGGSAADLTDQTYQWFLSGGAVSGATDDEFKLPASSAGKVVSVRVSGTYENVKLSIRSEKQVVQ